MSTIEIIEPEFKKIADGFEGSEGPVFDIYGRFYAVAPMEEAPKSKKKDEFLDGIGGKLYQVDTESGKVIEICAPMFDGYGGRPAGLQSDKEGALWIADMRLGLLKWHKGRCTQINTVDATGDALQGGNDLVFDDDGNLWYTGPGNKIAPEPEERSILFTQPVGKIYCLPQGGSAPIKVDDNFRFCNGIAVKGKLLLVAETVTRKIIAYDIEGPGIVKNRRVWADVPKDEDNLGGPDGMDFDACDQLLVANHGQGHIEVFGSNGKLVARIKCPFKTPSNVHFKPDSNICYVTEHDTNAVWSFVWKNKGMPMYCDK